MIQRPENRAPTHPGELLLEDFIKPHGLSLADTARLLRISYPRLRAIVQGKQSVTAEIALRLQALFGMDADFWLNLQQANDLWNALHSPLANELDALPRVGRD